MVLLACVAVMVLAGLLLLNPKIKNGRTIFIITAATILFLYSALRSQDFTGDVMAYTRAFNRYANYSFKQMLKMYTDGSKDPTFYLLGWLFSRIFPSMQLWLAFIALIYVGAVAKIIFTESKNPFLSFIMIVSLEYFFFSLTGLRQAIAMAITMLAYYMIKKRKPIKFVLIVLLASLFHMSAIVFLIIYPLARVKFGFVQVIIAAIATGLFFFGQSYIREFLGMMFEEGQYSGYASDEITLTITGFLIEAVIFGFTVFYYKKVVAKNPDAVILYNCIFIGLLFRMFASMIGIFFRLSIYFAVFGVLLVPLAIDAEENPRLKAFEMVEVPVVFIAYMLIKGLSTYKLFFM